MYFIPLILLLINASYGAKILCIASVPTLSHNIFFRPIWKALADRGHDLTVLTTNMMEEPYQNIKEIDLNYVYERKADIFKLNWTVSNWPKILNTYQNMFRDVAVMELTHPEVQNMLKNETEHFDLVIAEMHITLMFGFAHRFQCPLIGISSTEILSGHHAILGNPTHPILYPGIFGPNAGTGLRGRVVSVYSQIEEIINSAKQKPVLQDILNLYFGADVPPLDDLIRNMLFVFINTHPLFSGRPLTPKMVTIGGGIHIEKPKALPEDLQMLLDNSPQGVVYFSLGTNIRTQQYPRDFLNTTIEALRELPYQIIWKFNYEIENLPKNVKVFEWLPQQDLLRHSNVKAFITQGGLHSVEEAINAAVPMICIPFMSDQNKNVENIIGRELGIRLDRNTLTKNDLRNAVRDIVEKPRYKRNMITVSKLMRDQPMTGLEKAVWYVEYAIRNKDWKDILNSSTKNIPWYQFYLLDVLSVVVVSVFIVVYLLYHLLKIFIKLVRILYLSARKIKKD